MAHTPGPWEAKPTVGRIVLNGSSIYGVADITGEFARWNPDDLVLMAAAPDLLHALRLIAEDLNAMDSDTNGWREWNATSVDQVIAGALRRADLAIAKAEGRVDA